MFAEILSRYWGMTLLRGVIWVLFGIVVLVNPAISLVSLTLMFGAFALADGVASVVSAIGGRRSNQNWWLLLLAGLAGIAMGILTFISPGVTTLALLFYIAVWAIATGIFEILAAIRLRKEIQGEIWLVLAGALSVAFGAFVIVRPGQGALSVLWAIGLYAIALGLVLIMLAFKARRFIDRAATALRG